MKKQPTFQPVLMEIIVTLLFFALAMSIVVQLVAAANSISKESAFRSRAYLAMETAAEQVKADPEGGGFGADGTRTFAIALEEGISITGTVQKTVDSRSGGAMYTISLTASGGGYDPVTLTACRYRQGEEAGR